MRAAAITPMTTPTIRPLPLSDVVSLSVGGVTPPLPPDDDEYNGENDDDGSAAVVALLDDGLAAADDDEDGAPAAADDDDSGGAIFQRVSPTPAAGMAALLHAALTFGKFAKENGVR